MSSQEGPGTDARVTITDRTDKSASMQAQALILSVHSFQGRALRWTTTAWQTQELNKLRCCADFVPPPGALSFFQSTDYIPNLRFIFPNLRSRFWSRVPIVLQI